MRAVTDLLTEIRLNCGGCPDMLAIYALTQSLAEFLDRSEAWMEWATNVDYSDSHDTDGLLVWANATHDRSTPMLRTKRVATMRWVSDGNEIPFKTADQLQAIDPLWRTRTGTRPQYFTNEGEIAQSGSAPSILVSAYQARVYPFAEADDTAGTISARLVLVTNTVANMGLNDYDEDIPSMPDRIFYAFKDTIVSGALMHLLAMPGKDWTSVPLARMHKDKFEAGIIDAASRADMDYGRGPVVCAYGGI